LQSYHYITDDTISMTHQQNCPDGTSWWR